jgi:hypothetical protein
MVYKADQFAILSIPGDILPTFVKTIRDDDTMPSEELLVMHTSIQSQFVILCYNIFKLHDINPTLIVHILFTTYLKLRKTFQKRKYSATLHNVNIRIFHGKKYDISAGN